VGTRRWIASYSTRYAHDIPTDEFDESPQLYSESVKHQGRSPQDQGTPATYNACERARTHARTHARTRNYQIILVPLCILVRKPTLTHAITRTLYRLKSKYGTTCTCASTWRSETTGNSSHLLSRWANEHIQRSATECTIQW